MATYKKQNHKSKKNLQNSTTAEMFDTLDQGAGKAELWVQKHSKTMIQLIFSVVIVGLGYFLYKKYVSTPKESKSEKELYFARVNYKKAINAPENQKDSLYNVALNGDGDRYGLIYIIDKYSGTKAKNEAHYLAGMTYFNLKNYEDAISQLKNFESDDIILAPLALGTIGDAYANIDNLKKALEYYLKAFKKSDNSFTTPRFTMKAALTAMGMGNNKLAATYFKKIKDNYPNFSLRHNINALLAKVQK